MQHTHSSGTKTLHLILGYFLKYQKETGLLGQVVTGILLYIPAMLTAMESGVMT